eukprot:755043_1
MPGRTKLCYKKKSTKSNGSMQFISSRRNAHQKNRRTYSKFWMRMKREKSRNKSNYQHLQNVWNKTNTQLQQSQQENQELLAEQTLHEIERVSECDTDGDIDLYQAPYKLNEGSASGRYRALKNKRDEQLQALHEYEEQKLSQMKKDKQKRIQRKAQATESVELFENADAFIQKVQ